MEVHLGARECYSHYYKGIRHQFPSHAAARLSAAFASLAFLEPASTFSVCHWHLYVAHMLLCESRPR